jgi:hypothetical protein
MRHIHAVTGDGVEGAAAVGVAAILAGKDAVSAAPPGGILSGGQCRPRDSCPHPARTGRMRDPVTILTEADLRALVPLDTAAVDCIEDAFRALATKPVACRRSCGSTFPSTAARWM